MVLVHTQLLGHSGSRSIPVAGEHDGLAHAHCLQLGQRFLRTCLHLVGHQDDAHIHAVTGHQNSGAIQIQVRRHSDVQRIHQPLVARSNGVPIRLGSDAVTATLLDIRHFHAG